jgi:hypothetical protein
MADTFVCRVGIAMKAPSTSSRPDSSAQAFNRRGAGHLPGLVGLEIISVTRRQSRAAATAASSICRKARMGSPPSSLRRTSSAPRREGSGKGIALFLCTQMVLWPKDGAKVAKELPA